MDVGQIIGTTTAPSPRGSERNENKGDDFATYLSDSAEAREQSADISKDKSRTAPKAEAKDSAHTDQTEAKTPAKTETDGTAKDKTASGEEAVASVPKEKSKKKDAAETGEAVAAAEVAATAKGKAETTPVGPEKAAALNADSQAADKAKAALAGNIDKTGAQEEAKADKAATKETGKFALPQTADTSATATPAEAAAAAKAADKPAEVKQANATDAAKVTVPANASAKMADAAAVVPQTADAVKSAAKQADGGALDKIRADANAKIAEKDELSSKIAEMLRDGKGSIHLVSQKGKSSFQTALASSTNLVSASLAGGGDQNKAAGFANAALTGADSNTQQQPPAFAAAVHAAGAETTTQALPTHQAAVQGVDATAANSAAQANNAARASGNTPAAAQLASHFNTAFKEGQDHIKINLHPSELGRVEVKLEVGHDGRVIATVAVDKPHTLDMLQRDVHSLERSLQDAGFQTGQNSLNFSLRQDNPGQQFAGFNDGHGGNGLPEQAAITEDALPQMTQAAVSGSVGGNGNLDIQV